MKNQLKDKIAVVTGGSKGIGKSIAMALANEGCHVALASRTQADLNATAAEIKRLGVNVLTVEADVRKSQDVISLSQEVENTLGKAHILVNNAGIGRFADVLKMTVEDFRDTLETNLFGVFYCTQAFLPGMIQNKGGHIVNISSLAGKNSFATGSAYCASKHALISFAECLMLEVRHHGIKVSTICPGSVQTDFGQHPNRDKSWALTPEDVSKAVLDVLTSSSGSLMSLIELRPLQPPQKSP